jgi:hypothetical protein
VILWNAALGSFIASLNSRHTSTQMDHVMSNIEMINQHDSIMVSIVAII